MQLLPSTFRALEADLGFSPQSLAILGMCQAASLCLAAPFFGIVIDKGCSGKWILVSGSCAWGILTLCLACVTSFAPIMLLRTLNGIALATLTPVSQATIAKLTTPESRGTYFGYCGAAVMMGSLFCSIVATSISNMTILGHDGWRVAFACVAALSLLLSLLLAYFMQDIRNAPWRDTSVVSEVKLLFTFFRIRTFSLIVIQGCFGTVPWSALSFCTMFFQYVGIPDTEAALLNSILILALAIGHVIGGNVSDALTAWRRYHGRPLTAQISVLSGIPLIAVCFLCIPRDRSSELWYEVVLIAFGLTASWCGAGVNRPILAEIVPPFGQARVVSWLTAVEGSMAAFFGAPITGILAEHTYNYHAQRGQINEMPETVRRQNATALANSMLWMTILPWLACLISYSFLHGTYRQDVENAKCEDETTCLQYT